MPTAASRVTFIGPLPPPVTGMTAMSAVIVEQLQNGGPVRCFNWSRNKPLKGLRWKVARAWGVCESIVGLLASGRRPGEVLYYPANSRGGLYYDLVIVAVARLLGYRVVLHHHSYSYIDAYDRRMALLSRLVGTTGAHGVHCEKMRVDFQKQYSTEAEFLIVPPTIVSQELPAKTALGHEGFALGCISNLTLAKGLDLTISTFEQLTQSGLNVHLVLAGPCMGKLERELIDKALAKWPDQIDYRGPIYGEAKAQFFADIDAFLFPTRYKNESWGIVLTEAMSAGCPVIAYDRGCVSHIIQGDCGLMIPADVEFVPKAARMVEAWISDPPLHSQACQHAQQRYRELEQEAEVQLPEFVAKLRALATCK